MENDTVSDSQDEQSHRPTTRHFDVVQSEEDDDEHPISTDEEPGAATTDPIETFEDESLNQLYDDWLALDSELRAFEPHHKDYVEKLDKVESLKTVYRPEFDKYQKKLLQLQKDIKKIQKRYSKKGIEIS